MKKHIYKTRVRYAEVDQMGVVYYANYFVYMEDARADLLRAEGYPYSKVEDEGILLPVIETKCEYKSASFFEDELEVEVWLGYVRNASIKILYHVKKKDGTSVAKAYTVHPFVSKEWDFVPVPEKLRELLLPYVEEK